MEENSIIPGSANTRAWESRASGLSVSPDFLAPSLQPLPQSFIPSRLLTAHNLPGESHSHFNFNHWVLRPSFYLHLRLLSTVPDPHVQVTLKGRPNLDNRQFQGERSKLNLSSTPLLTPLRNKRLLSRSRFSNWQNSVVSRKSSLASSPPPPPASPRLLISPRSAAPPPDSQHHHHQSLSYLISSQNCCKISSFAFLPLSVALHQRDIIHKLPETSVKCKTGHVTDSSAFYYLQDKSLTPRFFLT